MWLIIRKSDNAVMSAQFTRPGDVGIGRIVKEWYGPAPAIHNPSEGVESYDPTLDNPDWAILAQSRVDFGELANLADAEIGWLEATIPQIDTMALEDLRSVLQRLAQENLRQIKAWRYLFRRLI